jgi:aminoglycoside phosphotransferase (APT) family kinase protein
MQAKMHADELDITAGLAARLIAEQFPQWASLPLRPVASAGTVHALYRLGDELLVRLPRRPGETGGRDQHLLRRLAPLLPVAIPATVGEGRPTDEYPCRWSVARWLDGENPVEDHLAEPGLLAADLAGFLSALWTVDLAGGPPAYRGGPLTTQHEFTLGAIGHLDGRIDTEAARSIWDDAVRLPRWDGPDTWIHADLMPGNVLTRNGRLAAVIDFECAGLGDPAQDLIVAWMLLPAHVRPAFRRAVGADDATWLRGRARALSMALGHLDYYEGTNPVMAGNARYTIREVLADHHAASSGGTTR